MPRKKMLPLPTVAKKRASYEKRSGMATAAARITAKALVEKPVFIEDADGRLIRQWQPQEMQRYGNDEIKRALSHRTAVEAEDMLEFVPPPAIRYCLTKGWIERDPRGGFFFVTRKAAAELDLPRKHQGRTIRFLDRGL